MSGAKKKSAYEFSAVPGGRAPKIFRLGNGAKKAAAAPDETAKEKKAPAALPEAPPAALP